MTVELAHPSSEPLAQRTTTDPPNPRWWFFNTTPGRILAIGTVLAMLGVLSAFAISTTINERQRQLTHGSGNVNDAVAEQHAQTSTLACFEHKIE